MLRGRVASLLGVGLALAAVAAACGGTVTTDVPGDAGGAAGATGGTSGTGGTGGISGTGGTGGTVKDSGKDAKPDVKDATSDYVDPGCPDAAPLPPDLQCDPLAANTGCLPGEGCYPYVNYPSPTIPCDQEQYGTLCAPVGSGKQGDSCGQDICAAGYVCAISGNNGATCMHVCTMDGKVKCPAGLLCQSLDVGDFHVCY